MKFLIIPSLMLAMASVPHHASAQAKPDILVLGDSQISFGAGKQYLSFFQNLQSRCEINDERRKLLKKLGDRRTAAIGVRSTSLETWAAKDNSGKTAICAVDKTYGVNAGAYGIAGNPNRKFVQIGKGRDYQFCKPSISAFQAALTKDYYDPKLLVLTFLGNSAQRWADSKQAAAKDVKNAVAQIPKDMSCVFLTTSPIFSKKTNDLRARAQANLKSAFASTNGRCTFVEGVTPQTRGVIEGQARYFSRRKDGSVKDPLHPKPAAIGQFLKLNTRKLCDAVFTALK